MRHLFFLMVLFISSSFAAQRLIIGTTSQYPPLASQSDQKNHFFGFEIDIMNAICDRLQVQCEYKPLVVSTIAPQLIAGHIDMAIAAISIPSIPIEGFIFSLPYLQSSAQFMTLKQSAINEPRDIRNKRVGVRRGPIERGRLFENFILRMYNNELTVVEYLTMSDLLTALSNKDVDLIFANAVAVNYWYVNNENFYKLIGTKIPIGNGYGIISTTKYSTLMPLINEALRAMMGDGTYLRIYMDYFG